jgi:hypothetical protein
MTERQPVLHLKPAEPSATVGSADRLASLIDGAARQQAHTVRPEQNRGKLLHAAFPDRPDVLAMLLQVANASGCSASCSPSCAVAFRLLQPATMPSGALCAKCHAAPRRAANQSYCHKCHSEDVNTRRANKDHELQKRRAMMGGLVVE